MGGGGGGWVGGKIIPRIRLTSAKDLVEVEAELGNSFLVCYVFICAPVCACDKQLLLFKRYLCDYYDKV